MSNTGCRTSDDECRSTFGHAERVTLPAIPLRLGQRPRPTMLRPGIIWTAAILAAEWNSKSDSEFKFRVAELGIITSAKHS